MEDICRVLSTTAPSLIVQRRLRGAMRAERARKAAGRPRPRPTAGAVKEGWCCLCYAWVPASAEAALCEYCDELACPTCCNIGDDFLCPVHKD